MSTLASVLQSVSAAADQATSSVVAAATPLVNETAKSAGLHPQTLVAMVVGLVLFVAFTWLNNRQWRKALNSLRAELTKEFGLAELEAYAQVVPPEQVGPGFVLMERILNIENTAISEGQAEIATCRDDEKIAREKAERLQRKADGLKARADNVGSLLAKIGAAPAPAQANS